MSSIEFDDCEYVCTGTVGPTGQRVFYLQVADRRGTLTVKMEKQQVAALADYLATVLADLPPLEVLELVTSHTPAEPEAYAWVVGAVGVAYDSEADRLLLVLEELVTDESAETATETVTVRMRLTRGQVAALVGQSRDLVAAGRPPCPFCGRPLDGDGSFCPCSN